MDLNMAALDHYMKALVPLSGVEWLWLVIVVSLTFTSGWFITRLYQLRRNWLWVTPASLCISWIPLQVITYIWLGAETWLPGRHTAIFFWGDSVCLPAIAVGFAVLRNLGHLDNPLADRRSWRLAVAIVAIVIAIFFHADQIDSWTLVRLHDWDKVWHDFLVYPLFLYFLGSQIPFLWETPRAIRQRARTAAELQAPRQTAAVAASLAVFGGLFGWWALGNIYDHLHPFQPILGFA